MHGEEKNSPGKMISFMKPKEKISQDNYFGCRQNAESEGRLDYRQRVVNPGISVRRLKPSICVNTHSEGEDRIWEKKREGFWSHAQEVEQHRPVALVAGNTQRVRCRSDVSRSQPGALQQRTES